MSKLIGALSAILGDGLLLTDTERSARARDAWMRSQIPISAGSPIVAPLAVCAPSSSEELAEVVRACNTHRTAPPQRRPRCLASVDPAAAAQQQTTLSMPGSSAATQCPPGKSCWLKG